MASNVRDFWNALLVAFGGTGNATNVQDFEDKLVTAVTANAGLNTTASVTELNLLDGVTASTAELNYVDVATPGVTQASKAIVLNSSEELTWAMTDAGTGTVTPLDFVLTASGAGASVDGAKFSTTTEAALGTYANGMNAKLDFGTAGKVSGLGGAFCSELDLGPGTNSGTYTVFEGELVVPSGASTGTETSFMRLTVSGADKATFDTNGVLLSLSGVTKGSDKLLADVTTGSTARPVQVLKVVTPDGVRYLPLYSTVAIGA